MPDELRPAWLAFFAILPHGWVISRPAPAPGAGLWTVSALRKPRRAGDPTVRVDASGLDEPGAVRALTEEFQRLGYARPPRGVGGGMPRSRSRPTAPR